MSKQLISLMIDEDLYKGLKTRCLANDVNIKDFISEAVWEKMYGKSTSKIAKRTKRS